MLRYAVVRVCSSIVLFFAVTLFVFVAFFALPKEDGFRRNIPDTYRLHGSMSEEYGWRAA